MVARNKTIEVFNGYHWVTWMRHLSDWCALLIQTQYEYEFEKGGH